MRLPYHFREFFPLGCLLAALALGLSGCTQAEPIPLERRFNGALFGPAEGDAAPRSCALAKRGMVRLTLQGLAIVSARINGGQANLVLDTGAERSILGVDAAKRLQVTTEYDFARSVRGIGQVIRTGDARLRSMSLGGLALDDPRMLVGP